MENLEELTVEVCRVARFAGRFIREEREHFPAGSVERKGVHDYVSYVDKESERRIVEELRRLLPEAGFITEEGSAVYNGESYCWVVDPLDGTTNFIHRLAPYAVSIALRKGGELLIGVVYEVCADKCFYAWKGGGAYVDGRVLSVSKAHDADEALLCIELPYDYEAYSPTAHRLIRRFYGKAGGIRMNGSAAVALCYVADGRLDGWIEKHIGRWDFSAGALIVLEAGGRVTDFSGSVGYIEGDEIVASNGMIHDELLQVLASAD